VLREIFMPREPCGISCEPSRLNSDGPRCDVFRVNRAARTVEERRFSAAISGRAALEGRENKSNNRSGL
jgi:hypothetical protein